MEKRPKILIVDDDKRILLLLQSFLKPQGYDLVLEQDAGRALVLLRDQDPDDLPDLVLTDVVMPELDGYDFTKAIKGNATTTHIPVLMVSSLHDVQDKVRALDMGVEDFITKPVDPSELKARVRSLLKVKALHDQKIRTMHALEQSYKALRVASQLRDEMEQITRHDLKTPLTTIIGIPRLLMRKDNITDKQKDLLKIIEQAGYRMLRMINMSLELMKIERGSYAIVPSAVNMLAVLEQIGLEMRSIQVFANIPLRIHVQGRSPVATDSFLVLGEELLCYSMLANLVRNAMEATPAAEPVDIFLTPGEHMQTVRITNQGEVPESMRPRFFQKYATAGKEGGTGLGTYAAKLFAQAQGGTISLDTTSPGFTSVVLRLPALPMATEPEEARAET